MSSKSTMGLRLPSSPPAWFQLIYAGVITGIQGYTLYNPASTQEQLGIADPGTMRIISLCLISIKAYEAIGALQESWPTYWASLIGRLCASYLMFSNGGGWSNIAPIDFASAAILALCMAFAPTKNSKSKGL